MTYQVVLSGAATEVPSAASISAPLLAALRDELAEIDDALDVPLVAVSADVADVPEVLVEVEEDDPAVSGETAVGVVPVPDETVASDVVCEEVDVDDEEDGAELSVDSVDAVATDVGLVTPVDEDVDGEAVDDEDDEEVDGDVVALVEPDDGVLVEPEDEEDALVDRDDEDDPPEDPEDEEDVLFDPDDDDEDDALVEPEEEEFEVDFVDDVDVELVDVPDEVPDEEVVEGAVDVVTGAVDAVGAGAAADLSVSVPVPPRNTTGMLDWCETAWSIASASLPAEPVISMRLVSDAAWLARTLPLLSTSTYVCLPPSLTSFSVASSEVVASNTSGFGAGAAVVAVEEVLDGVEEVVAAVPGEEVLDVVAVVPVAGVLGDG